MGENKMYLSCTVNETKGALISIVAVGPNNQPHGIVSINGVIKSYPIDEITLDDYGDSKEIKKGKK